MESRAAIAILLLAPTAAFAAPSIRSLGVLPGPPPNGGWTHAVSSDGRTVCGYGNSVIPPSGTSVTFATVAYLSPTLEGDFSTLPPLANPGSFNTFGFAFAASDILPSAQRSFVVGYSSNASGVGHATLWSHDGSLRDLGTSNPTALSIAYDISPDGSTAVGVIDIYPCLWMLPGNAPTLLPLGTYASAAAYGISSSGQVIAGAATPDSPGASVVPVRWVAAAAPQPLALLPGAVTGRAFAISDDGTSIVGAMQDNPGGTRNRAFLHHTFRGTIQLSPLPAPSPAAWAGCVSAAGSLIGGFDDGIGRRAVIWNRPNNPRLLADVLSSLGVNLTGWHLAQVRGISADGSVISGFGRLNGVELSFLVTLPPLCPSDYNLDYTVDFFDYLDFVADLANTRIDADFNRDGAIDLFDYLDFIAAFTDPC